MGGRLAMSQQDREASAFLQTQGGRRTERPVQILRFRKVSDVSHRLHDGEREGFCANVSTHSTIYTRLAKVSMTQNFIRLLSRELIGIPEKF